MSPAQPITPNDAGDSGRMGPEIAATHFGVLTDVVGFGLGDLNPDQVADVVAVHPRGEFEEDFLSTCLDGLKNRPETTSGTVNSDVLAHFVPGFRRTTTVERIMGSGWPS
ncbi:hypothetical protein [Amycolatopsis sp. WQ 127309]|uniref:hypothetical protein n=1 Tax=Amycolatopsis sp. WQ 127309 TaxID=2932773 RepID=UPI001FF4CB88|nr:hypothetical protein [Amycolatopsis sp. WQ 127309]UOZ05269.1 hypothetical protein MUY22_41620 [Amycolatopsis sp. WQ 127309]